jgi:ATP-dependent DNA ligase
MDEHELGHAVAHFRDDRTQAREWYQGCKLQVDEHELRSFELTRCFVAEPKRDGIWVAAFFDANGVKFWSRTQEEKPYSLNSLIIPNLFGACLVGELGFGSQESRRRRAQLGLDFMDVFDVLCVGYDWTMRSLAEVHRRAALEELLSHVSTADLCHLLLVPRWDSGFQARYEAEPEGLILKSRMAGPYVGGGERVSTWYKCKRHRTVDYVIMGWEKSTALTKADRNMTANLRCGAYVGGALTELTKVGGMDHAMSLEIALCPEKFIGRVVELKHFGRFRSGALRHPSIVRLRDDKRPGDCVFDPVDGA